MKEWIKIAIRFAVALLISLLIGPIVNGIVLGLGGSERDALTWSYYSAGYWTSYMFFCWVFK